MKLYFKWTPETKTLELPTACGTIRAFGIETYEQLSEEIAYIIKHDY